MSTKTAPEPESDETLFERYSSGGPGSEEAIHALIQRYEPRILGFIRKRLDGDRDRALDLWSDTLVRVHGARHRYDPSRKFSTWIHTIANNLIKNEFRNRSRRGEIPFSQIRPVTSPNGTSSRPLEFPSTQPTPEHNTYRKELQVAIQTALARMEPHHRIPFVMREIEDRTYEEIAQTVGIPLGTVKSRLARARNSFRAVFPYGEDFPKPH